MRQVRRRPDQVSCAFFGDVFLGRCLGGTEAEEPAAGESFCCLEKQRKKGVSYPVAYP